MKATGFGLNQDLNSFAIIFNENIGVLQKLDKGNYYFKEYHLNDGYCYSVCSTDNLFASNTKYIDLAQVIEYGTIS